jgi:hypothetical protein
MLILDKISVVFESQHFSGSLTTASKLIPRAFQLQERSPVVSISIDSQTFTGFF